MRYIEYHVYCRSGSGLARIFGRGWRSAARLPSQNSFSTHAVVQ
jgi:hypothetical protein